MLVDDLQDASFAQGLLLRLLVAEHGNISAAADDDQAIRRFRGAATKNLQDFRAEWPDGTVVRLEESFRSGEQILRAACAVVEPAPDRIAKALHGEPRRRGRVLALRRRARAGAGASAAEVERLIAREDVAPEDVGVLVRSVRSEGQAVAVALEERAVPYRLSGAAAFFQRAEVRDLLAWLRLLVDPGDAGAVVRALARPPVELRAIDLARVHADRPAAKARHGRRARRRDRVAADPARGARAHPRTSSSSTARAARGARLDAAGPLRAPADRASRAAPSAPVRRADRGRRAAA